MPPGAAAGGPATGLVPGPGTPPDAWPGAASQPDPSGGVLPSLDCPDDFPPDDDGGPGGDWIGGGPGGADFGDDDVSADDDGPADDDAPVDFVNGFFGDGFPAFPEASGQEDCDEATGWRDWAGGRTDGDRPGRQRFGRDGGSRDGGRDGGRARPTGTAARGMVTATAAPGTAAADTEGAAGTAAAAAVGDQTGARGGEFPIVHHCGILGQPAR